MKKKKLVAIICAVLILFLTACGEKENTEGNDVTVKEPTVSYSQSEHYNIPDDEFICGDSLSMPELERNMKGIPAMYMLDTGTNDDGKMYAQIVEYSLNKEDDWDMQVFAEKSLTKLFKEKREKGAESIVIDYIVRGDDGNLYALMAAGSEVPRLEDRGAYDGMSGYEAGGGGKQDDKDKEQSNISYSVLQIGEDVDNIRETPLQFAAEMEITYEKVPVTKFHVFEDGSPILVFQNSTAAQFSIENGVQTSTEENVPDNALDRNAAFGAQEVIYYSSAAKSFGVLDLDTMSVTKNFGGEMGESEKGKEWYYDVCGDNSQIYAFNTSGLYQIRESGKQFSAVRLSLDNSFSTLENVTIYDVLVDENEAVYVLMRKEAKESTEYDEQWEFGVEKFEKQK